MAEKLKCNCGERIRKEIPHLEPSAGYDEIDEVLGLLRVARGDAQMYHDQMLRLQKLLALLGKNEK